MTPVTVITLHVNGLRRSRRASGSGGKGGRRGAEARRGPVFSHDKASVSFATFTRTERHPQLANRDDPWGGRRRKGPRAPCGDPAGKTAHEDRSRRPWGDDLASSFPKRLPAAWTFNNDHHPSYNRGRSGVCLPGRTQGCAALPTVPVNHP